MTGCCLSGILKGFLLTARMNLNPTAGILMHGRSLTLAKLVSAGLFLIGAQISNGDTPPSNDSTDAALAKRAPTTLELKAAYCEPVLRDDIATEAQAAAASASDEDKSTWGAIKKVYERALSHLEVYFAAHRTILEQPLSDAKADGARDVRRLHEIQACFAQKKSWSCSDEALNLKMIVCPGIATQL